MNKSSLPSLLSLHLFLFLTASYTDAFSLPSSSPSSTLSCQSDEIELVPSTIKCSSLTHSYPVSLLDKLFSSVPRREYAVQNIDLSFGTVEDCYNRKDSKQRFNLFVGSSGCGKSTVLKIIEGSVAQTSGEVLLNESVDIIAPKPIIIDSKPSDIFDERTTVLQRIIATADECLKNRDDATINPTQKNTQQQIMEKNIIDNLARQFATIMGLSNDQILVSPSQLSPSGQYLFGLACACMESTCAAALSQARLDCRNYNSSHDDKIFNQEQALLGDADTPIRVVRVPCPILLLDELLDNETSIVARKVGQSLKNLTERGGIVLAATHRPQYLQGASDRVIRFSAGKILST